MNSSPAMQAANLPLPQPQCDPSPTAWTIAVIPPPRRSPPIQSIRPPASRTGLSGTKAATSTKLAAVLMAMNHSTPRKP
ncbi:hypothetical protein HEP87_61965 [Streptomyces sp. S1D4-11]|nr:hypothetical protein [Streptomyces sp. S1D4-11]